MKELDLISIFIATGSIICAIILIYFSRKGKVDTQKLQTQLETTRQDILREEGLKKRYREKEFTINDIYFDCVE